MEDLINSISRLTRKRTEMEVVSKSNAVDRVQLPMCPKRDDGHFFAGCNILHSLSPVLRYLAPLHRNPFTYAYSFTISTFSSRLLKYLDPGTPHPYFTHTVKTQTYKPPLLPSKSHHLPFPIPTVRTQPTRLIYSGTAYICTCAC